MQTYVPSSWAFAPVASTAARRCACSCGHTGSLKATCATTPPPKNDRGRATVRSMNWSTSTSSPGAISSRIEPTALTEMRRVTPSCFIPCTLAREFTSVGDRRCPFPYRGRKIISCSPSFPMRYSSLGSPKGVMTLSRRTPVNPGRSYNPDPPITPRMGLGTPRAFLTLPRTWSTTPKRANLEPERSPHHRSHSSRR